MTNFIRLAVVGLGIFALAASGCGSKSSDDDTGGSTARGKRVAQGYASGKEQTGTECSQELLDANNAIANSYHEGMSVDEIKKLRQLIVDFKANYAGVKCTAVDKKTGDKTTLNVTEMADKSLKSIDDALKQNGTAPGNGNNANGQVANCTPEFINDLQTLMQQLQGQAGEQQKQLILGFKAKYNGLKCTLEENGQNVVFDVNDRADKAIAQIDGGGRG